MSIFKRKDPSDLQSQLAKFDKKGSFESDKNEWNITRDKEGAGSAVIRFLPAVKDDATTFVKIVTHGFQKNGKWYIENCSSTHGDYDSCPACQWVKEQNWDYNNEADRNAMYSSGTTRKIGYWANVLVVKDPACPENEGQVFKYRFGKKILDKIQAEINVDPEMGEEPCDVTCPWTGKNFFLKVEKVGGHPNYDKSKFQTVSAIPNIDDESFQQELFGKMHDIMAIVAPDKFKSKEELTTSFNRVMGAAGRVTKNAVSDFDKELEEFDNKPARVAKAAPAVETVSGGDSLDDDLDALISEI